MRAMATEGEQRSYDHRLVRHVQRTGDPGAATGIRVPRSTAAGWPKRAPGEVRTAAVVDEPVEAFVACAAVLARRAVSA